MIRREAGAFAELDRLKIRSDDAEQPDRISRAAGCKTKHTKSLAFAAATRDLSFRPAKPACFKASFVFEKNPAIGLRRPRQMQTRKQNHAAAEANQQNEQQQPKTRVGLARGRREKSSSSANIETAEKQYQEILTEDPNNFDALSNLGVVYVRSGKLRQPAESALKKASDHCAQTTNLCSPHWALFIIGNQEFDDALAELTKAIEINPKKRYCSQLSRHHRQPKGRQQEAEKEILQAHRQQS